MAELPMSPAVLQAQFPGWRVWRTTDAGTWYATRRGPHWAQEPRTVAADTAEGLCAELRAASDAVGAQQ